MGWTGENKHITYHSLLSKIAIKVNKTEKKSLLGTFQTEEKKKSVIWDVCRIFN